MTRSIRPPKTSETRIPGAGPRERVHERMRQMARLTLLAAAPLTNAACDPAPTPPTPPDYHSLPMPTCQKAPASWVGLFHFEVAWQGGEIHLTVAPPSERPWLRPPSTYTVQGGTRVTPDLTRPNLIRILPDTGATVIQLTGEMTCHTIAAKLTITIDLADRDRPMLQIDPR